MEALHTHRNQFGFCPNGPDFQHFLKYGVKNEKQDIFLEKPIKDYTFAKLAELLKYLIPTCCGTFTLIKTRF